MDTSLTDKIIIGRVEPQIYAFTTNTVPNYLKVGDTYRPLEQRLDEWRVFYSNLKKQFSHSAKISDDTYFRDYAVHLFLEKDLKKKRLTPEIFPGIPHFSNEFFLGANKHDVKAAINDIQKAFDKNTKKYQYYELNSERIPIEYTYKRIDNYPLRPNQQETVDRFNEARKKRRTNLLMYAVMRFGKSFTSMCCAFEMKAKLVLVVSAKADVREEWKKTVESHKKFADYVFLDSDKLRQTDNVLSETLKKNRAVVFLTLQDLMGDEIKAKHKEIFENEFDLLLIDESHYGARASEYGKVLRAGNKAQNEAEFKRSQADSAEEYEDNETLKALKAKIRIHLSGTPYRILMADEFTDDDIIAFYQFSDITHDQEQWDKENLANDVYPEGDRKGQPVREWDNPYYGFPQMVRFAFNPNASAQAKMQELRERGISTALSELMKPQSINKDESEKLLHTKFLHEKEVLDLMQIIDGSKKDENILSFLDYDKIKEGKMCRHIVIVLPYCASCDAMERLIKDNAKKFKNLASYEIINISGVDKPDAYPEPNDVKEAIHKAEDADKKTITLTVNKMLTGSTVEEWDTMIYLKSSASAQEYDQAIFRLQNQYVKECKGSEGDVIKYNMKPQTLLVDFDPNRMFRMQEQKSQIYNVNTDMSGNTKLEERIKEELRISPIITANKGKLKEVEPINILNAVREYSASKSIMDEAIDIPDDYSLLDVEEIKEAIKDLSPIDDPKGINTKPVTGDGDEYDIPPIDGGDEPGDDTTTPSGDTPSGDADEDENEDKDWFKKLKTYYSQILFFAFLTKGRVKSLEEVIAAILENDDNKRIARNVGLVLKVLLTIQKSSNPFILSKLDYKIYNINSLINDDKLSPEERVDVAMKKFGRLSFSEIVTPQEYAEKIVDLLPKRIMKKKSRFLDIASKKGEFARAFVAKYPALKDNFYSIPTSALAYEFTRKVYTLLGMPVENIIDTYTSYEIIDTENNMAIIDSLKDFSFAAIVGNPPYQDRNVGEQKNFNPSLYDKFLDISYELSDVVAMIHPAKFLFNAGGTKKSWNDKMLSDAHLSVEYYEPDSKKVFEDRDIKGGVAITYHDKNAVFQPVDVFTPYPELNSIRKEVIGSNGFSSFSDIVVSRTAYRFTPLLHQDHTEAAGQLSKGHLFDVSTNVFERLPQVFFDDKPDDDNDYIQILGRVGNNRVYKYIRRDYVKNVPNLDSYKLFLSSANGNGMFGESLTPPIIGFPTQGNTETFISIGQFESLEETQAAMKYVKSKFARTLLGILKRTHHISPEVWKYVPLQNFKSTSDIDWTKSLDEIDDQLIVKYKLLDKEGDFIRNTIQPME